MAGTFVEHVNQLAADLTPQLILDITGVVADAGNIDIVATNIVGVSTVATNIADVNSVALNMAEVLNADTNAATATTQATNAQLRAWEAEAEKMTADSYATEAEDVFVKVYTSVGNGTFTSVNTTEYSSLHYAAKAAIIAGTVSLDDVNVHIATMNNPIHVSNVRMALSHAWSAGITDGGAITDNGNGTVSIAAGEAMLRTSASAHTVLYSMPFAAQANIALADNQVNYVYIDYNAGTPVFAVSSSNTAFNCMDKCIAYTIAREGTKLYIVNAKEQNVDTGTKMRRLFLNFANFIHSAGGTVLGTSGRNVTVTSGSFNYMITEIPHPAFDTSVAGTANENVFAYYYRDGVGGWTRTADNKLIDNLHYDNGTGTLANLSTDRYTTMWVYMLNDSPSQLAIQYGQINTGSLATAQADPVPPPPPAIAGVGALIGRIIINHNDAVVTECTSAFTTNFTGYTAVNHNDLSAIQGGAAADYYHLTNAQYLDLTDGGSTVLHTHASDATKLALAGGVMTGAITALRETKVAMGANDINLAAGNLFTKTISGTTTLTVSNWLATGNSNSFVLELTNGGSAVVTWFSGVKWASGVAPTLTASGVDILGFYSHDGGATVRGIVLAKDSK